MELKVTTLDGKAAGSVALSDDDLRSRAARRTSCSAASAGSSPSAGPARTRSKDRAEIGRTGKKMYKQKGTGGARHGSASAPQFRGGGKAFGPVVRSHAHRPAEEGARAGAQACAVGQGQGRRHRRARQGEREGRQDQGAGRRSFAKLGLDQRADHRRRRGRRRISRCAARNIPNIDVLPVQGINVYDILRRDKLVLTKAAVEALEARFK